MPRLTMTYELAHAAGWDAGSRSMRAAGRKKWSRADYNAFVREFSRLWPEERAIEEARARFAAWCREHGREAPEA